MPLALSEAIASGPDVKRVLEPELGRHKTRVRFPTGSMGVQTDKYHKGGGYDSSHQKAVGIGLPPLPSLARHEDVMNR